MDRLDAMTLFVAAAEDGSLAAAARRLGRSAAAATRAVAMLEAQAGETLLLRSTRGLRLTPAGERRLAAWRDVLLRLEEAEAETAPGMVAGRLAITAPELFGRAVLLPLLEPFLDAHPGVEARLHLANPVLDLSQGGVDVAVRFAALPDSGLVAVTLGQLRRLTCASPAYLARHGTPQQPADLASHRCLGLDPAAEAELWPFRDARGRPRSVPVRASLSVSGAGAMLDAALRGRGIVRVLDYQVADHLRAGRLRAVLPAHEPDALPANLVFRPRPPRRSPLRAFVDEVLPSLRRHLLEVAAAVGQAPR